VAAALMPETGGPRKDITRLLKAWRLGDHHALDRLLPIVYDELRRVARVQLSRERRATLQPTELVHEAFVRLVDQRAGWQNRSHFFGIAAKCMRRILIDHARKKRAAKRPQTTGALELENLDVAVPSSIDALLAIDQALDQLAGRSPRQSQIAELKIFAGLEIPEIAEVIGVSEATVKRDWSEARKRLAHALKPPT
jgi:RNA polymerase sigma-70 factor (ECF subfamily)